MKPIETRVEDGVVVKVYPPKEAKSTWMKNYNFYAALKRVDMDSGVFAAYNRKAGKG